MPNALVKFEDLKDSPVGKIPKHWDVMSLDQACINVVDCPHTTPAFRNDGVLVARTSTIRDGRFDISSASHVCEIEYRQRISRLEPQPGDIVFTREAPVGEAFVIPEGMRICLGQRTMLLRPNPAKAFPSYVLAQIYSGMVRTRIDQLVAGTTNPHLNVADVRSFLIPIPTLFEQQRIAEILNTIDSTIAHTSTLIAKLKQMKAGLLHDLLTRGLDENGELRDAIDRPEQFKDSPLGQIPKNWETPLIEDIAIYVGSGITPFGGSKVYKDQGITFIRSQNVTFEGLLLDDVAYIDEITHEHMKRSEVFAHDVLLNITGASIGRCCPLPEGVGLANVNQHVCAIRLPEATREDAQFLAAVLSSFIGQSQIDRLNAGGNREGLNYQQLRAFLVPYPKAEERREISNCLDSHNTRIHAEETYLNKLKEQKKGLMHDLLTGRVRVTDLKEIPT